MNMERKKESDDKLVTKDLDQITKIVAELTQKLRLSNVLLKNLHENKLEETTQNEEELNYISRKIEETAAGINKFTIETTELHNNRQKWRELANIPTKREATGRNNVQATDSGIDSSTYSGTSMVMDSNAFTGIQDTNPHQSSSFISSEVDGRCEASAQNGKDSEFEC
ncbi:unnamed protein product [Mytilus coruscus]|uniref:Uncharacterized protein n=1 Tax=Mytilus coruscus TaxID=42192 RepID=A0A6J8CEP2_MYTCO|nr:unnamed protein product [Mytilus coruscus]